MYRQGDVLLIPVKLQEKDLKGAKVIEPVNGKNILALGEATGHHHFAPSNVSKLVALATGVRVLQIAQATEISHQEHGAIPVPAGEYEVRIQQEWSPLGWRQVLD